MLTPNALETMARELLAIYDQAELDMIGRVCSRLARGITQEGWAEKKYAEVSQMKKELSALVDRLEKETDPIRREAMTKAFTEGSNMFAVDMRALGIDFPTPDYRLERLTMLMADLNQRTYTMHQTILRTTVDAYRRIIGESIQQSLAGTTTTQGAVAQALDQFAKEGIAAFYDKAGRQWGMAEYSEMSVRTGMMRASVNGYVSQAQQYGEDQVIITDHSDECPLCRPWENAILSLSGSTLGQNGCEHTLSEAQAAGLFHPNCLHSMNVYVAGLSALTGGDPQTASQSAEGYENRQKQRYMERQVRQWKRRQAASIDPQHERVCKGHVDQWQSAIRKDIGGTDYPRKYSREGGRVLLTDKAKKLRPVRFNRDGSRQGE